MNKSTECPACENTNPRPLSDNSYYCEECGKEWTVELQSIDDVILDHAQEIERLMRLKDMIDDSEVNGVSIITINKWHDNTFEVECSYQDIKTIRRKKHEL